MAEELEIEPSFPKEVEKRTKKLEISFNYDYESADESVIDPEKMFEVDFKTRL